MLISVIYEGGFFMKIILMRHAETTFNNSGRFCGRTDCDITENGRITTSKLASIEPSYLVLLLCMFHLLSGPYKP